MCHILALLGRQTAYFPSVIVLELWSGVKPHVETCFAWHALRWILRQEITPLPYFSMPSRLTLDPLLVHIHIQRL